MQLTNLTRENTQIIGLAVALGVLIGYNFISAQSVWTSAPANPPSNNAPAPINVGTSVTSLQPGTGTVIFDQLEAFNRLRSYGETWSPQFCNPATGVCATVEEMLAGGATVVSPWLVNNKHTEAECFSQGGQLATDNSGATFCRLVPLVMDSCPQGWQHYNGWGTWYGGPSGSDSCRPTPVLCTLPGIAWSANNTTQPSCSYAYNTNSNCGQLQGRQYSHYTEMGCY
jgi:hypothetical protein